MKKRLLAGSILVLLGMFASVATAKAQDAAQKKPPTPSEAIVENWNDVGNRLVAMAEDWPEDKYGYRPTAGVRSFAEVMRHLAGSNYGLINGALKKKVGVEGDDPSPDTFKTKAQIVEYLKKSVADGGAAIHELGDDGIMKHLDDWIGYIEHMGEHYGQLVVYYRNNGVVPPASRPKK
jgi:uncharacterized damage-inducible protein DinB